MQLYEGPCKQADNEWYELFQFQFYEANTGMLSAQPDLPLSNHTSQ